MNSFTNTTKKVIANNPNLQGQNGNQQIESYIQIEEEEEFQSDTGQSQQEHQDTDSRNYQQKIIFIEEQNNYASHQDSDSECEICYQEMTSSQHISIQCKDVFHKSCLQQYLNTQISNKKFPLNCPNFKCKQHVQYHDIKEILNDQDFQKYEMFQFQSYIDSHQEEFLWCLTPGCQYVFAKDDSQIQYICPVCEASYCMNCKQKYHSGLTCQQYQESIKFKELDQQFYQLAKSKNLKQCSKCKMWIEKINGDSYIQKHTQQNISTNQKQMAVTQSNPSNQSQNPPKPITYLNQSVTNSQNNNQTLFQNLSYNIGNTFKRSIQQISNNNQNQMTVTQSKPNYQSQIPPKPITQLNQSVANSQNNNQSQFQNQNSKIDNQIKSNIQKISNNNQNQMTGNQSNPSYQSQNPPKPLTYLNQSVNNSQNNNQTYYQNQNSKIENKFISNIQQISNNNQNQMAVTQSNPNYQSQNPPKPITYLNQSVANSQNKNQSQFQNSNSKIDNQIKSNIQQISSNNQNQMIGNQSNPSYASQNPPKLVTYLNQGTIKSQNNNQTQSQNLNTNIDNKIKSNIQQISNNNQNQISVTQSNHSYQSQNPPKPITHLNQSAANSQNNNQITFNRKVEEEDVIEVYLLNKLIKQKELIQKNEHSSFIGGIKQEEEFSSYIQYREESFDQNLEEFYSDNFASNYVDLEQQTN
ncbi:IBR domain protein (macronuclear) [Tetrahymena thermophila SB210]|uniref:RBR-type E3 ubiquitin transferase n=1 Tax=Tetrahymena thermophila (strain SB210) TaxID=312017 RepID=I7M1V1_TETTS|nr:IBR domain protein [Tetrahymena thermophila SB210]EAR97836.2 IBR domain protein [Tetrahymena thermophila SB210]|eukprot:XP_001018081.2 IBR domain protein [Tetrahymena thermophila SB210]